MQKIEDPMKQKAQNKDIDTNDAYLTRGTLDEASLKARIPGWGADVELEKRPGYWDTKSRLESGIRFNNIERQIPKIKIHKSLERPTITPIFGTSAPPRLLSGMMRDYAYAKHSEGMFRHWLWLIAADRVDMVESLITDAAQGKIPNLWKEMGLKSEWKYNRANFVKKVGVGAFGLAAAGAAFWWLTQTPKTAAKKRAIRA